MTQFPIKMIKGVIPALITCFDEEENFDEQRMRKVVKHLLTRDIGGFYLTGSTGESFLMTPAERKRVVEVVIDEVDNKVPIIVHVGAIGTKISVDLAKHAYANGAEAISSVPPFYWNFKNDNIFEYYKDITESTPLPMIIYNIPLAGLVGLDMIKNLANIDGVKGIKYTAATHYEIMRIKNEIADDFMVYSGSDEMALSGLSFKADGLIGSFYNLMPEIFIDIFNAVKNNDMKTAYAKQETANKIIFTALEYDYISLMKRMMGWMGVDAGYGRSPFSNYSGQAEVEIKEEFKKLRNENNITDVDFLNAI